MTTTQWTVETAPRNLDELKLQGRFNLRVLAKEAGGLETEAAKSAFMALNNDKQAEAVLGLLLEIDKKKGGGGAATGSGRQPVTKGKKAPATNGTTSTPAASTAGASEGGKSLGGEGAAKLLAAVQALEAKYTEIKEELANLNASLETLQGISSGTNRFVTLAIGLSLKLAEQVLQAAPETVMQAVIEDMPMVETVLLSMAPPAADEDEGEEEEEDEGNE